MPSNSKSYSRMPTGNCSIIFAVTTLRFSRCCRSANGATTPSRITSSSPSSTAWKSIASRISGKAPEMSSAPREYSRRPPAVATSCTRMPSHFHSARQSGGCSAAMSACFQRVREHRRAEHRRVGRVGLRPAALQPGEQRQIGRCKPVPDLLDVVGLDAADLGQRDLRQPGGGADAQPAGDQLQQRQPGGGVGAVQPRRDEARQRGFRRGFQRLDHLGQARRWRVGRRRRATSARQSRPGRRHSRRTSANSTGSVRAAASSRIRPGLAAVKDSSPVIAARPMPRSGSGWRGEIAPQQRDLGVARGREDQALQQVGEGDHARLCWGAAPPVPTQGEAGSGTMAWRRKRDGSHCLCQSCREGAVTFDGAHCRPCTSRSCRKACICNVR